MAEEDMNKKNYLVYVISYSPFIALLIGPMAFLFIILISVLEQMSVVYIDIDSVIDVYFVPFIFSIIFIATIMSLFMSCFYWHEINNSDLEPLKKKEWKKVFFKANIFASSLYFDYKYINQKYFLQVFFQKSRRKILGQ